MGPRTCLSIRVVATTLTVMVALGAGCTTPDAGEATSADPPLTGEATEVDSCVEKCIFDNQMRAVAHEVLEADCRNECAPREPR